MSRRYGGESGQDHIRLTCCRSGVLENAIRVQPGHRARFPHKPRILTHLPEQSPTSTSLVVDVNVVVLAVDRLFDKRFRNQCVPNEDRVPVFGQDDLLGFWPLLLPLSSLPPIWYHNRAPSLFALCP